MSATQWLGDLVILSGILIMAVGVYGLLRYRELFTRILIASKIDTMGLIIVLCGAIIRTGLNFHSLKILIIMAFAIVTNPMVTHSVARSAYSSGQRPKSDAGRNNGG